MKRRKLIRHLLKYGCVPEREGAKHTLFYNSATNSSVTVPRHTEINTFTGRGVCRDLGIPIIEIR